jgi:NAD(P)-dependent dehydrogenase (short-subunit alcohol dehydrogenase family)
MSTWLITGCSTGLGRALAEAVIATGHNAVVTARDANKVADLAEGNTDRVLALSLDVTDGAQVTKAVTQAEKKFGGIDVLVNNAGYGYRAAVEEGDDPDIRQLFETQFFGAVAMIKAVLPGMRAAAQARSSTSPRSVSRSCPQAPAITLHRRPRSKPCLAPYTGN